MFISALLNGLYKWHLYDKEEGSFDMKLRLIEGATYRLEPHTSEQCCRPRRVDPRHRPHPGQRHHTPGSGVEEL